MVHYPGNITYQADSKFIPISLNNIQRMSILAETDDYLFVWKGSSGFVFDQYDLNHAVEGVNLLPAMVVALREIGLGPYKQAHKLRIRETFSGENIATTWYMNYVDQVAPIVCDKEHLEGGFMLWKSFLKRVSHDHSYQIRMIDLDSKKVLHDDVTTDLPESGLWGKHPDTSKMSIVLVLGKRGFTI